MLWAPDELDFGCTWRLGIITGPSPGSWACAGSVCCDCIVLEEVSADLLMFRIRGDDVGGVSIVDKWVTVASTLIFHGPVDPDLGRGFAEGEISPRRILAFIFSKCGNAGDCEGPINFWFSLAAWVSAIMVFMSTLLERFQVGWLVGKESVHGPGSRRRFPYRWWIRRAQCFFRRSQLTRFLLIHAEDFVP